MAHKELFDHFEKSSTLLQETDIDFCQRAKETAKKLPKIKIGKHGQIMEWMKDYDEAEPGHRHISHLWALHPAFQITPDNTPDLCDAAKITLQRRRTHRLEPCVDYEYVCQIMGWRKCL